MGPGSILATGGAHLQLGLCSFQPLLQRAVLLLQRLGELAGCPPRLVGGRGPDPVAADHGRQLRAGSLRA